ncbi:MAG: methyl-accepting chemotaxis protein, partial [Nitrospira sp.]|nr:methyl-accepting chemotaxis protein [Nitrospira sp.]
MDRSQEIWFQEAKKGNTYISQPYPVKLYLREYKPSEGTHPEKAIEKNLIVIAMPHAVQDQIAGVLMVTTTPDFLYSQVDRLKPEHGQAFIINAKGEIIAHSDKSLISTQLEEALAKSILERSQGWLTYQGNLVIYAQNEISGWKLGVYIPEKDILSSIDTLRSKTVWIILISLVVVGPLVILFTRKLIIAPLKEMVAFAEAIRDGDLTGKLSVKTSDEVGRLGKVLNSMLATVRTVTGRTRESSDRFNVTAEELRGHSSTLNTGAEDQYISVEKISNSIQPLDQSIKGLSKDAENLFSAAEETSASMLEMKATLEEVAGAMEDLSSSVNQTASSIEQMTVSIKQIAANTERLSSEAESTYQAIHKINASIQEVSVNVEHSRKLSEETT